MGELLPLQKEHPNTLLDYHEQERGSSLGDLDRTRTIAYDLRDFEQEIFIAELIFTGDGATRAGFEIAPGAFTRPRSIQVLGVVIQNEAGANRTYTVNAVRPFDRIGGVITQNSGVIELGVGTTLPALGIESVIDLAAGIISQYQLRHVNIYANKPGGVPPDTLEIASTQNITAAGVVICRALWRTLPDPSKFVNGAPGFSII